MPTSTTTENGSSHRELISTSSAPHPPSIRSKASCQRTRLAHESEPPKNPRQADKRLIATADPTRVGILSDQRESKELYSTLMRRRNPTSVREANKRLIATFTKLKNQSSL